MIGVPAAVCAWMVFYLPESKLRSTYQKNIQERQKNLIQDEKEILEAALAPSFGAIRFLSDLVGEQLPSQNGFSDSGLERELEEWIHDHPDYRNVDYLDGKGREIFRISQNPDRGSKVKAGKNANREAEHYFLNGRICRQGQTFVSKLTLDMDIDSIRIPPVPVLRFVSPVCSSKDKRSSAANRLPTPGKT